MEGPLGPVRGDYQAALVAAVVANAMSGKGKRFEVADFLLWDRNGKPNEPQTPEQMLRLIESINRTT